MKTNTKILGASLATSACIIAGITYASVNSLPNIPQVQSGDTITSALFNDIRTSLAELDQRTDGGTPQDTVDLVNKGFLDTQVSNLNTAIGNASDNLGNHTASQNINMSNKSITNLSNPSSGQDATTKSWVESYVSQNAGGSADNLGNHTASQNINMNNSYRITNLSNPSSGQDATTKSWVESYVSQNSGGSADNLGNHTASQNINMNNSYRITNLSNPSSGQDATTKSWVESYVSQNSGGSADNLGNHTASQDLNMGGKKVLNVLQVLGQGNILDLKSGSNTAGITLHTSVAQLSNVNTFIANGAIIRSLSEPEQTSDAATKGYVDSKIGTGGSADNLGNHTATQDLNMNGKNISNLIELKTAGIEAVLDRLYIGIDNGAMLTFGPSSGNAFFSGVTGFSFGGANVSQINTLTATTINETSDQRLKENITPLQGNILEKIDQIDGVSFTWKDTETLGEKPAYGVIAQEVEKVFPELVHTAEEEINGIQGKKSVNYSGFVAPFIEAIKELNQKNKDLENAYIQLQTEHEALKTLVCLDHPTAEICQN